MGGDSDSVIIASLLNNKQRGLYLVVQAGLQCDAPTYIATFTVLAIVRSSDAEESMLVLLFLSCLLTFRILG